MLELRNISKDYKVADSSVHALKELSLNFRKNEFVSILGPSGCGKTTLLNIIGGLDHATGGDLIINGVSTKNFSDRDWDTYRNHSVGFVFQSYNLIPHQTILENVELALTISGIGKHERVQRAKKVLDRVGLSGQYNKKPNQLSGGQCQRVAIARALVNDPEILLADEPTGALDSETSVQIMDLIKEIANSCLVIMVTHNPDLATKYSTRIIKLLDGKVVSDSFPYTEKDIKNDEKLEKNSEKTSNFDENVENNNLKSKNNNKDSSKTKKSKLSFWTAFKLSAKNLFSKLKRTLMVCFAGSIGIIGVATVLAISSGVQSYIASMQNDMLSGNPVTVSEEAYDLSALMSSMSDSTLQSALENSVEDGKINVDFLVEYLVSIGGSMESLLLKNDITEDYINFVYDMPEEYYSEITSSYGLELSNNLYTDFKFNGVNNNNMSISTAVEIYRSMLNRTEYKNYSQYITSFTDIFSQAPENEDFILSQYDIVSDPETSKIAKEKDEIMLVLSKDSSLTDLMLTQLGYYSQDEFFNIVYKATGDEKYDETLWKDKFTYEEILGKTFTWYPNDTIFNKLDESLSEKIPFSYNAFEGDWTNGIELKITAILMPKENVSYGALDSGIYYTSSLAKEIIDKNISSLLVSYFLDKKIDSYQCIISDSMISGIVFSYDYEFEGVLYENNIGVVGSSSNLSLFYPSSNTENIIVKTLTLQEIGGKTLTNKIKIYPTNFEIKEYVTNYLDKWNEDGDIVVGDKTISKEERSEVQYTDNLALVISIVNTLINVITTALIAFTALSLVVSTVMIAIITYVSVMERVKEIGVIRSLGGRKRDVSSLFIAETFIIGLSSGIFGILITYLISFAVNMIIGNLYGIFTIASLPFTSALIMIAISILLTLISGLIPASLAAKKDPVEALRTE